jgi:hypothetical protein
MSMESHGRMILMTGENQRTWRKTCPSSTLSTTNPTWIDLGVNPGLHIERPATNHLSHGMAPQVNLPVLFLLAEMGATIATGSPGRRSSKRPTPSHLRRTSQRIKWFRTLVGSHSQPSSQLGTEAKSTISCSAPHSLQ